MGVLKIGMPWDAQVTMGFKWFQSENVPITGMIWDTRILGNLQMGHD